jgi:WD40 repeat protein
MDLSHCGHGIGRPVGTIRLVSFTVFTFSILCAVNAAEGGGAGEANPAAPPVSECPDCGGHGQIVFILVGGPNLGHTGAARVEVRGKWGDQFRNVNRMEKCKACGGTGKLTAVPERNFSPTPLPSGNIEFQAATISIPNTRRIAFSRNGLAAIVGGGDGLVNRFLAILDTKTGREIQRILSDPKHLSDSVSLSDQPMFLEDERYVLVVSGRIRLLDVATGKFVVRFPGTGRSSPTFAYSSVGFVVAIPVSLSWKPVPSRPNLLLWDLRYGTGSVGTPGWKDEAWWDKNCIPCGVSLPENLVFSPDGRYIVSDCWGGTTKDADTSLRVYEVATKREVKRLEGLTAVCRALAISPDGSKVLAAQTGGHCRLWEFDSGREVACFYDVGCDVPKTLAISPDSTLGLVAGADNTICLLDLQNGQVLSWLVSSGPRSTLLSFAFAADGRHVLAGSEEEIRIWDLDKILRARQIGMKLETQLIPIASSMNNSPMLFRKDDTGKRASDVSTGKGPSVGADARTAGKAGGEQVSPDNKATPKAETAQTKQAPTQKATDAKRDANPVGSTARTTPSSIQKRPGVVFYVLKDGNKIGAVQTVDAGDEMTIKDEAGKFHTIKKADIEKTVESETKK